MSEEPSSRLVLNELLEGELSYEATTSRGLTNHLPMALVAKSALGAPADELRRFAALYETRLVPRTDTPERVTRATWERHVGRRGSYDVLSEYFLRRVDEDGVEQTIRSHLAPMVPGVVGAAFHGAIRLAYALEVNAPNRVAAGLAYLAENAVPMEAAPAHPGASSRVEDLFARLGRSGDVLSPSRRGLISEEMLEVAAHPTFQRALADVATDEGTFEQLRALALELYATTDDFTALHGVTGVAALDTLRPYVEDERAFERACVTGLAAAYVTIGSPALASREELDDRVGLDVSSPAASARVGAMSDDEHVAKLIYTALGLFDRTGDELYRYVASRQAGFPSTGEAPDLSESS